MNEINYNQTAFKRDKFIKAIGKNIKIEGIKGNQYFLQEVGSLISNAKLTLEIGTGTGVVPTSLGHLNKKMLCIDSSKNMIKIAKSNCRQFPHINFVLADLNHLPFQNGQFDLVIKRLAPDNFREIHRVLSQNGGFANFTNGEFDGKELKDLFELKPHQSVQDYKNGLIKYFKIQKEKEFIFKEIYRSPNDLIKVLEIAPIIPDYGSDRNRYKDCLENLFKQEKYIILTRHKYFSYATKTI